MDTTSTDLYLDLIKLCLINYIYCDHEYYPIFKKSSWVSKIINKILDMLDLKILYHKPFSKSVRFEGRDWPAFAHTMIGLKRLNNLQYCMEKIYEENIPGDFLEAGIWRGGSVIFMKAFLKAKGISDRVVWAADSFKGLPIPNVKKYPQDRSNDWSGYLELSVSLDEVKNNFKRYGLLDNNVKFIEGWFSVTFPNIPIGKLALLRIDGDLYESTMDCLVNLYPKLVVGGFIIVDDYNAIPACKKAVDDYRNQIQIHEIIQNVDYAGIYWQRTI